jgi:hypothetical protein
LIDFKLTSAGFHPCFKNLSHISAIYQGLTLTFSQFFQGILFSLQLFENPGRNKEFLKGFPYSLQLFPIPSGNPCFPSTFFISRKEKRIPARFFDFLKGFAVS